MKIKQHEISDNLIMLNNKETVLLGAEQINVGVNTNEKIIVKDPDTGLNESVDKIVCKPIYKLSEQKHHSWFVLDLETGKRGWYLGKNN